MSIRYAIADLESNSLWSRQQKDFLVIQGTDFLTSIQGASLWPEETDAEYELKKMLLNFQSMQHVNVPNLRVVQVDLDQHRITTIPVATKALPQMPNGTLQKPLSDPSQVTELRDVQEVAAILEHGDFLKQLNKMSAASCANWLKNMDGRTYTFRNADVKQKFGNLVTQTQEEGK